jgi:hypothetical protein
VRSNANKTVLIREIAPEEFDLQSLHWGSSNRSGSRNVTQGSSRLDRRRCAPRRDGCYRLLQLSKAIFPLTAVLSSPVRTFAFSQPAATYTFEKTQRDRVSRHSWPSPNRVCASSYEERAVFGRRCSYRKGKHVCCCDQQLAGPLLTDEPVRGFLRTGVAAHSAHEGASLLFQTYHVYLEAPSEDSSAAYFMSHW